MNTLRIYILIIVFSTGCSDDDHLGRSDGPVVFRELADDLTGCRLRNLEAEVPERFVIIEDKEELAHFVSCEKVTGTLNFEQEFILAGRVNLPQCGFLRSQRLELKNNTLEYTAYFEKALCQMPTAVDCFAVVPREYLGLPVEFVVMINDWR